MGAVQSRSDAASWQIGPLTTYADPQAMAGWLEHAEPGQQIVYATGPLLGDHPAVKLARNWQAKGAVHLFQRKAGRANCTDYCAEKRPKAGTDMPRAARGKDVRRELSALARHLRSLAAAGKPCPSFAAIAAALELPRGNRGRRRAQYLLGLLESEGRVRIDRSDARNPKIEIPRTRNRSGG
ncbi:hypothetical protein [Alteriqipengyuania sp.]